MPNARLKSGNFIVYIGENEEFRGRVGRFDYRIQGYGYQTAFCGESGNYIFPKPRRKDIEPLDGPIFDEDEYEKICKAHGIEPDTKIASLEHEILEDLEMED